MSEQAVQTLKIAHIATATSGMNFAMLKFKEIVERDSHPQLRVEIFPNGEQGGEVEMVERARQNTIQAVLISTAVMSNYSPTVAAVTLPYLFRNSDSVQSFMESDASREILNSLEKASLVGLGYCYNNFFNLFIARNSRLPTIRRPEDIAGEPFRSGQSAIWAKIIETMGFTPVAIPFYDLEASLKSGKVNGCDGIIGLMDSLGYERVLKSITVSKHWIGMPMFSINKDYFESLSPHNQKLIRSAAPQTFRALVEQGVAEQENQSAIESFRRKGVEVVELGEDALRSFSRRTRVVHELYAPIIGRDLMQALYKACKY